MMENFISSFTPVVDQGREDGVVDIGEIVFLFVPTIYAYMKQFVTTKCFLKNYGECDFLWY